MLNTIAQYLQNLGSGLDRRALHNIFGSALRSLNSCALSNSTLVITATTGKKVPKTGAAASYYIANGVLVTIANGVDMPALSGTVTNLYFNVFCFFVDSAGTKTSATGTQALTLAGVKWPNFPADKALIGLVLINPTGTGDFVGNTTALDDATVVPTAVYISPVGAVDPTVIYT